MSAYSPKTGARCSCRPGVQRDNCPRCEGTGWVIDFKKIHERKNPAQWAHGTMSYRQPPGSVATMRNNPSQLMRLNARRRRRNPYRRNPGKGGGTNWLLIGGVAVGAFFLLRPTTAGANPLSALFGGGAAAPVPPGYTPIGSGLYRAPNGAIVARNPQTGQMVMAPAGSQPTSAEDLLMRAGISMIPSVTQNLASWVSSLFSTQQTATGAVVGGVTGGTVGGGGGTVTAPDILSGAYNPPGLPPLEPLPDIPWDVASWGSEFPEYAAPDDYSWLEPLDELPTYPTYGSEYNLWEYGDPGGYDLPSLPPLNYDVGLTIGSGEAVIANPDDWWGYFGLGRHDRRRRPSLIGFRATPPVY